VATSFRDWSNILYLGGVMLATYVSRSMGDRAARRAWRWGSSRSRPAAAVEATRHSG
jgi:hypothetical protein